MGLIITGVVLGLVLAKSQRQIDPCVIVEAKLCNNIEVKFLTQLNSFTRSFFGKNHYFLGRKMILNILSFQS